MGNRKAFPYLIKLNGKAPGYVVADSPIPHRMKKPNCIFCKIFSEKNNVVLESEYFFTILDNFPVNKGHTLIIPKRHQVDIFKLNKKEEVDLFKIIQKTKKHLDKEFSPDGYNIGINCGEHAGQTVFHLHIHIIPRYKGDIGNARGGIRNFKKPLVKYN